MKIEFNIRDNATTNAKILAYAKAKGYELFIRDAENNLIPNPEAALDYAKRILKREFLEPWVTKKATEAYQAEYDNLIGD